MLQTLRPNIIGHFDLIRLFRPSFPYSSCVLQKIQRNIDWVAKNPCLVEINSRALKKGLASPYPQKEIFTLMKSKNIRFTLADDSHGPQDVGYCYKKELYAYLQEMQIQTVYYPSVHSKYGSVVSFEAIENVLEHLFWQK
jgi:histidinol-phosphatase (PHP family)